MMVYQDGREFYDEDTGEMIFEATKRVPDFDMEAAEEARREFLDFADREGLEIEWA